MLEGIHFLFNSLSRVWFTAATYESKKWAVSPGVCARPGRFSQLEHTYEDLWQCSESSSRCVCNQSTRFFFFRFEEIKSPGLRGKKWQNTQNHDGDDSRCFVRHRLKTATMKMMLLFSIHLKMVLCCLLKLIKDQCVSFHRQHVGERHQWGTEEKVHYLYKAVSVTRKESCSHAAALFQNSVTYTTLCV